MKRTARAYVAALTVSVLLCACGEAQEPGSTSQDDASADGAVADGAENDSGQGGDAAAAGDTAAPDAANQDTASPDSTDPDAADPDAASPDAAGPDAAQQGLTVHACSTFTVVQDSAGKPLAGVQHAEESLPAFVHKRDVGVAGTGAAEILQQGVTFRLQTPVFFLRSSQPTTVSLQASLPSGVLSAQWPKATNEAPAKQAKLPLAKGVLSWSKVKVDDAAGPTVSAPSVWQQLEKAGATGLSLAGETAPFVFYQGLAALDVQVKAASVPSFDPDKPAVALTNQTGSTIPAAWYVHVHDGGGMLTQIGAVPDGVTRQGGLTPKEINFDLFSAKASQHLQSRLVEAGLTPDEAKAMVGSWAHNYFKTHGRRVLYLAPAAWVAKHLPTEITPAPAQSARVVVGRIELLSKAEEQQLMSDVKAAASSGDTGLVAKLGVFAEPRLRRAYNQLPAGKAKEHCAALIALAAKAK